jgi:hypothetical protein
MPGVTGTEPRTAPIALTGWFSFLHGEITAGDLLALRAVQEALDAAGLPYDTFWSPGFRPDGPALDALPVPAPYGRMLFVCGPLHGEPVRRLHEVFARSHRVAVGVSVLDPADPAVAGFDRVLARDAPAAPPAPDLAFGTPARALPPVAAVVLTEGQGEYGSRRRHAEVSGAVLDRLRATGAALLPWDTRIAADDWRVPSSADRFEAVLARADLVVTSRLHGLVTALRRGVPALAVDPVAGGAKLTAQAHAVAWPAILGADEVRTAAFDRWWEWCLGPGRAHARAHEADADALLGPLLAALSAAPPA